MGGGEGNGKIEPNLRWGWADDMPKCIRVCRNLSVTNLSLKNNFAGVSTECSSHHQGYTKNIIYVYKTITNGE